MKDLTPFIAPVVIKPSCASCKAFAPDCIVPVGDGGYPMCWLCAHHVVEHEVCVEHAFVGECDCGPDDIYPEHVISGRRVS